MTTPAKSLEASEREAPSAAGFLESIDPATGEAIARFDCTPPAMLVGIVARAREAQAAWAARPVAERAQFLRRLGQVLYARRKEIAELVSRESGKPRVEALFAEAVLALDTAAYYAREAPRLLRSQRVSHHNPVMKTKRGRLEFEPWGVIAVIAPWNYPFAIPLAALVPAVVAGNAVVLKPSEFTPWCGAVVAELFEQADFPPGLVQVVQGRGEVGAALIEAAPDKVFFTGSVATGRRVAGACAARLIPSVLELGGKDAVIVLADADLELASSAAVWGSFTNCGQACLSVERLYVERAVAPRFIELCLEKTRRLRLGPGSDPDVEVGPMIRGRQVERVEAQLHDAIARGARVLLGGRRRPDLGPCFFEPTLVTGVDHSMLLMREETFGPVLAIVEVADAEEAVRLANDSPFGLSASVWTKSAARGRELASRLRVGAVMVNDVASYYGISEAPHGGRGASGWGRTHSRLGLLEMVQVKYVDVDRLARQPKSWWYGYDAELAATADAVLDFLFAPSRLARWRSARGALGALFRRQRI
jgi:acyl-CoA reductase-like NAD-dependent aldehyde dehydrogenase